MLLLQLKKLSESFVADIVYKLKMKWYCREVVTLKKQERYSTKKYYAYNDQSKQL